MQSQEKIFSLLQNVISSISHRVPEVIGGGGHFFVGKDNNASFKAPKYYQLNKKNAILLHSYKFLIILKLRKYRDYVNFLTKTLPHTG